MKKFFIRIFIFLFIFSFWSYYRLDGFQLCKVKAKHLSKALASDHDFENIKNILSQKFYYLSKGRQCFVFVSEDDNYVIKLLNHRRFELPWQIKFLTFIPYFKQLEQERNSRKRPSYESYLIACHLLKEETGILYVKMDDKSCFHQIISLKDKANNEHKIDLIDVDFVLQKKAKPIYSHLAKLYEKNKAEFKKAINAFLEVVSSRIQKNIIDDDLDIQINYGFLNEKAILIDPGRLCIDDSLFCLLNKKTEMLKSTKKLREWIESNYPDMVAFFDEMLQLKIYHQ